jgi:hypothetical protein
MLAIADPPGGAVRKVHLLGGVGLDGYGATVDVHGAPVGRGVELLPVAAEQSCVICGNEDSS